MTRKQKRKLIRIIAGLVLFGTALLLKIEGLWGLGAFLIPYLVVGYDVIFSAVRNLIKGQVLDENFLMSIASIGAFITGDYHEAVAVMIFYRIGDFFESYAVGKTRKSVAALMDIRPDYAKVLRDGQIVTVDPDEVAVGDLISIDPGERIPLDGIIVKGATSVNNSALTGESVPVELFTDDSVISGSINLTGNITVRVTKPFGESTVSKILELVENAAEKKAKTENFITKFARWYTPCVVIAALFLAVLPSLITGDWNEWVHRALIFLVVSCPCALVISVPMSFFGGIGGASRRGILIKGSSYIEALSKVDTMVFDKTGTLTKGEFSVAEVVSKDVSPEILLRYAAVAESHSSHPIALSVVKAYGGNVDNLDAAIEEISGKGIKATFDGREICVGNIKLMDSIGLKVDQIRAYGTVLYVAVDYNYLGYIRITDTLKPESASAIKELKSLGVSHTVMLTGDRKEVGEAVGKEIGIDEVCAELLPANKVTEVERLLSSTNRKGTLVYVGDGINDAPVLSRSDIGIAMGALGSDAAIEAADIVLMDDNPLKIAEAVRVARKTMRITRQNIVFALAVKGIVLLLGAVGFANMWLAVFADVGVSVIAILNAMRALGKTKR